MSDSIKKRSVNIEKEVIQRVNNGDTKAFELLYSTYYVYLCAVAVKYVYKPEMAEEIVNDVFLNVWNNRSSLFYPIKAYLVRAVQNQCLSYYRKKRLDEIAVSDIKDYTVEIYEQLVYLDSSPLACLENKELANQISKAIDQLPEKCREIFIQHLYYNKTYEEIARMKNISSSTVRVQIKQGLSKLRNCVYIYVDMDLFRKYDEYRTYRKNYIGSFFG